jgi:hypothetical protein
MAVKAFGLDAICRGLQEALKADSPVKANLADCQERLLAAAEALEELG